MCLLYDISAMPKEVTKAKIACLNFSLQKMKLPLGISVVVQDPEKLQAIRDRCVCVCMCVCVMRVRVCVCHACVCVCACVYVHACAFVYTTCAL